MEQSQNVLQWLIQLTQLEADKSRITKAKAALGDLPEKIEAVRNLLPTSILSYHDSLRARGRVSVAPVRNNNVCSSCHLVVPRGTALELRRSHNELTVCNNCGVFIYLPEEEQQQAAAAAATTKPTRPRKKATKKVAAAAAA